MATCTASVSLSPPLSQAPAAVQCTHATPCRVLTVVRFDCPVSRLYRIGYSLGPQLTEAQGYCHHNFCVRDCGSSHSALTGDSPPRVPPIWSPFPSDPLPVASSHATVPTLPCVCLGVLTRPMYRAGVGYWTWLVPTDISPRSSHGRTKRRTSLKS